MKKLVFSAIAALAIAIGPAGAQTLVRTASFTSNVAADTGQCTVEVMVPGEAQIKIEGDSAKLYQLGGRSPEWRRFECTSPMPKKPASFRLETASGRGHEELIHGPRHNGGKAVIYIDDPKHGEDTYSFNVIWGNPVLVLPSLP